MTARRHLVARALLVVALVVAAVAAPAAARAAQDPPDPPRNIAMSPSTLSYDCYGPTPVGRCETTAVTALDDARRTMGIAQPYALPSGFFSLPPAQQLLILSNDDRTYYGLDAVQGLNPTLSASAYAGAVRDDDPDFVDSVDGLALRAGGSNWAGGFPDPLTAYYFWMYDDGPGSGNLDCQQAGDAGCWGHRHDTLFDTAGATAIMGAAAVTDAHGDSSYTELYESVDPTGVPTYSTQTAAAVGPTPAATDPRQPVSGAYPTTAFTPVAPTRLCDTRTTGSASSCAAGPVAGGQTREVRVAGVGPVPADATMAVLTVTVTDTTATGFVTVWPSDRSRPLASAANWVAGRTVADLVQVPLSATGAVDVYVSGGSADVVVDVSGYGDAASAGRFDAVPPARVCDTRSGCGGLVSAGAPRSVPVAGRAGVPQGAKAVVLDVAVTTTSAAGFLTAYPSGGSAPLVSNTDWVRGQTVADRVVVPLGPDGSVDLAVSAGTADLVVDVSGYYGETGAEFTPIVPTRVCDTRAGQPQNACDGGDPQDQRPVAGWRIVLPLQQAAGLPSTTTAVAFTTTSTGASGPGFLAAYPDGEAWPGSSDVNLATGSTVANLTITALGADGALDVADGGSASDVVLDVSGYYS